MSSFGIDSLRSANRPRKEAGWDIAPERPWLAIPSRSDSTSCLMLLTTGSGKPVRSSMVEPEAGVISLAMCVSYRNELRSVKAIPPGLNSTMRPDVTALAMESSTVYAQRVVQPTWGGTVISAEAVYPFSDLALARRLERAEASRSAAFVETRAELQPGLQATWTEVAGAYAMFRSASRRRAPEGVGGCFRTGAPEGVPPAEDSIITGMAQVIKSRLFLSTLGAAVHPHG